MKFIVKPCGIIRSLITFPFRVLFIIIGVPNIKIVYRSGHVEYYYFKNIELSWSSTDGHITDATWETVGDKRPVHINIREIESVVELY